MRLCVIKVKAIEQTVNFAQLNEVFGSMEGALILGGNCCDTPANRFSYWMAQPREVLTIRSNERKPLEKLNKALQKYSFAQTSDKPRLNGIFWAVGQVISAMTWAGSSKKSRI